MSEISTGFATFCAVAILAPAISPAPLIIAAEATAVPMYATTSSANSSSNSSSVSFSTSAATTKPQISNTQRHESINSNLGTVDALALLERLAVKGRAPKTGYSRSAFGPQWRDVDRNGCDTRNDILKRDLINISFREKTRDCVVETGILRDPYSNTNIDFIRGEKSSMLVQIDHVVALSNAWQTGIFKATPQTRIEFANDPINLLAVKGSLNSQKGDGDAATWLPPNKSFRCEYVKLQISVKAKYELWVTKPEKEAMQRVLGNC